MSDSWIQYNGAANNLALYNELVPQLQLSGLNPDSTYTLRMTGSNYFFENPTVYTVVGESVAGSQSLTTFNNLSQGITFLQVAPNSSGVINIYVNCPSGLSGINFSWICGLQVYSGSTNVGAPQVAISLPTNGTVYSEGGNVVINATATETAGSIAKVQFFSDTTLIGEVDTVPYNFTWVDPDPGSYTITATATDASGTINSATVSVGITSLNYYWSTTGNVGNNADSTFVGNVDSVRLDFRTKDIQRMSITATGNVGIGTISPTAQLHVTGSVRLAGLIDDSTNADQRMLVSDTLGNIAYRNLPAGGTLAVGPGLGETPGGAIALGDTVSGTGPHSFTANRYEYLNGYQYSIGGSVNDPVNQPDFLWYDNGDWTAGTTMNHIMGEFFISGLTPCTPCPHKATSTSCPW
jgi:Bacterial Ig domain